MESKWKRSRSERMLGGVCGGLSGYLRADVTLVRVFFVVAAMASGLGAVLYVVLWLITPPEGVEGEVSRDEAARIALEEMGSQAQHLGEEAQSAMDSDDPRTRMIVRWSLAMLIGLALSRARPRRRTHHRQEHRKQDQGAHSGVSVEAPTEPPVDEQATETVEKAEGAG